MNAAISLRKLFRPQDTQLVQTQTLGIGHHRNHGLIVGFGMRAQM